MELALIGIVALLTAGVTLVSGFGLGTILMPVFALFFPVPLAATGQSQVNRIKQPGVHADRRFVSLRNLMYAIKWLPCRDDAASDNYAQ